MGLERSQRPWRLGGCRAVTGQPPGAAAPGWLRENCCAVCSNQVMVSSLTQAEVLIALVVAAHAGVLAVRLAASLYRA